MKKAEALERWRGLPEGQNPLRHMVPIKYKATGSTYGACGVRIDGTPAFVDAVLSNLKGLIDGENQVTRLGLNRREAATGFKDVPNAAGPQAEVCYVRLHVRGHEGQIVAAVFDRHLDGATERHADLIEA